MSGMAAQPRRIVVGYDGSEAARRALDRASELAGYGSTLTVVNVRRAGAPERQTVERAREHLLRRNVTASDLEPCGGAATELVEAARSVDANLLIVGRRSALKRALLGSVSAAVVRDAPCDVLVVR
jgi:nucleotide-binding universal stress UspA family protein